MRRSPKQTKSSINKLVRGVVETAERGKGLTAELEQRFQAWATWHEHRGEWRFVRQDAEGKLWFTANGQRAHIWPADIAEAERRLDVPRSRKSAWSAAARVWLEAVGIDVKRVRYMSHSVHAVRVWYWTADGEDDECSISWEYLALPAAERAAYARREDENYRTYRCTHPQCSTFVMLDNPEGDEMPDQLTRPGACQSPYHRGTAFDGLLMRESLLNEMRIAERVAS